MADTKCVMRPPVCSPDLRGRSSQWMRRLSALANWSSTLPSPRFCMASGQIAPIPCRRCGREHQLGTEMPSWSAHARSTSPPASPTMRVPLDGRRHRQRNAGIARGGLDQRVARLDVPTLPRPGGSSTAPGGLSPNLRVCCPPACQNDGTCAALSCAPMRYGATGGMLPTASSIVSISCALLCHNLGLHKFCPGGEIGRRRDSKSPP